MDSSGDVVIRAEGLGKKYTIKHSQNARYSTIRDLLSHQAAALGRWANPFTLAGQICRTRRHADREHKRGDEDFWALRDVSFEIRRGERVGIIGRNGAGKSTLLKILSRITEPTTGRVQILGRVASLLEVGTGFHPELTGRENIYLNGAILGMTSREIRSRFDEIVDFAEVEKFLDTPVKRYSSGMYVRLAFAVAAHLEPEILVVDEVLAVGDSTFQKKCLGKMEDIADNKGRTVLFVSHQMSAIQALCTKGILLSDGQVSNYASTMEAVSAYLRTTTPKVQKVNISMLKRTGSGAARFHAVYTVSQEGLMVDKYNLGEPLRIVFEVFTDLGIRDISIGFSIHDANSQAIALVYSDYDNYLFSACKREATFRVIAQINSLPLSPGQYTIEARMTQRGGEVDWPRGSVYSFEVLDTPYYFNANALISETGLLSIKPKWTQCP